MSKIEIWKPIEGYELQYAVSNLGRIKNLTNGKMVRPYINDTGYYAVNLYRYGKVGKYLVHRLVAKTFVFNKENKPYVNHINGDKLYNVVSNLEWCTQSENVKHAYDIGLHKIIPRKLSDEDVVNVLKMRSDNVDLKTIAEKYNVSTSLISSIINGRRRKKVMSNV